jgi:hypothetical protein
MPWLYLDLPKRTAREDTFGGRSVASAIFAARVRFKRVGYVSAECVPTSINSHTFNIDTALTRLFDTYLRDDADVTV